MMKPPAGKSTGQSAESRPPASPSRSSTSAAPGTEEITFAARGRRGPSGLISFPGRLPVGDRSHVEAQTALPPRRWRRSRSRRAPATWSSTPTHSARRGRRGRRDAGADRNGNGRLARDVEIAAMVRKLGNGTLGNPQDPRMTPTSSRSLSKPVFWRVAGPPSPGGEENLPLPALLPSIPKNRNTSGLRLMLSSRPRMGISGWSSNDRLTRYSSDLR